MFVGVHIPHFTSGDLMNYGLVIAAGKSSGFGPNVDRAFLSLGSKPILAYSLLAFEACENIDGVVLVVRKDRVEAARSLAQIFGCSKVIKVVAGGVLRQTSIQNGLAAMPDDVKLVTVHESSRPGVTSELISETLAVAKRNGAAAVGLKITDTIVSSERGTTATKAIDASKLWILQSPQSFKVDILRRAIDKVDSKKDIADEAAAVEKLGEKIRIVPGSRYNIKIIEPDDVPLVATLLKL
jgi:2-C-methyl-D-erythritol 4-phosphate cytidylyltransferase